MIDVKMGTYVIQTDFTVEESRLVVRRIWVAIVTGNYETQDMTENITESINNINKIIKDSSYPETHEFDRLRADLIYCKRRLYAEEGLKLYE